MGWTNKDKEKEYNKKYREKNKEYHIEYNKEYREENKEYFKIKGKKYRKENKEYFKIKSKKYREENKEYFKIKCKENHKKRCEIDPLYKLSCIIRKCISNSFRKKSFKKNSKTFIILGCDSNYFFNYIEAQFEPWMTWKNYGKYDGKLNCGWDLDHIIPISSANTENEVIRLNYFSNFQPLCSKINRNIKMGNLYYRSS